MSVCPTRSSQQHGNERNRRVTFCNTYVEYTEQSALTAELFLDIRSPALSRCDLHVSTCCLPSPPLPPLPSSVCVPLFGHRRLLACPDRALHLTTIKQRLCRAPRRPSCPRSTLRRTRLHSRRTRERQHSRASLPGTQRGRRKRRVARFCLLEARCPSLPRTRKFWVICCG